MTTQLTEPRRPRRMPNGHHPSHANTQNGSQGIGTGPSFGFGSVETGRCRTAIAQRTVRSLPQWHRRPSSWRHEALLPPQLRFGRMGIGHGTRRLMFGLRDRGASLRNQDSAGAEQTGSEKECAFGSIPGDGFREQCIAFGITYICPLCGGVSPARVWRPLLAERCCTHSARASQRGVRRVVSGERALQRRSF